MGRGWTPSCAQTERGAEILDNFTEDSFAATDKAVAALAASGDVRALPILDALKTERLFFTPDPKRVYIKGPNGSLIDAASGEALAGEPAGLKPVRLNNRVRGALANALGAVMLSSPDAARRAEAAQSIFKSRDTSAVSALMTAMAKENDAAVKSLMELASSALIALDTNATEADRTAAIKTVTAHGDSEALAVLDQVAASSTGAVKAAAEAGGAWINTKLTLWSYAQNAWYGLSLGSVLLLAAIGLAITFGVMGVINMAHGEMVMLGAYVTFITQEVIRTRYLALFDYSF